MATGMAVLIAVQVMVTDNLITGNYYRPSFAGGGAVYVDARSMRFADNVVACNARSSGIMSLVDEALILSNVFAGNGRFGIDGRRSEVGHHDVYYRSSLHLDGNLIIGNQEGGILMFVTNATLSNNTLVDNAGFDLWADCCDAAIFDCIIWQRGSSSALRIGPGETTNLRVSHSLVKGGQAAATVDPDCTLTWGPGNIDADPRFVDPGHWDDAGTPDDQSDDFSVLGDYHLLPGSPCIDAGTNDIDNPATTEVETLPEKDIAGVTRIIDGNLDGTATVDMGAYEYLPGDVNHDGRVNILDLIRVRNAIGQDPASEPAARLADLNLDGKVDILDMILARYALQGR